MSQTTLWKQLVVLSARSARLLLGCPTADAPAMAFWRRRKALGTTLTVTCRRTGLKLKIQNGRQNFPFRTDAEHAMHQITAIKLSRLTDILLHDVLHLALRLSPSEPLTCGFERPLNALNCRSCDVAVIVILDKHKT